MCPSKLWLSVDVDEETNLATGRRLCNSGTVSGKSHDTSPVFVLEGRAAEAADDADVDDETSTARMTLPLAMDPT